MKQQRTTQGSQAQTKSKKAPERDFLRSPRKGSSRLSSVDGSTTSKVLALIRRKPVGSRDIAVKLGIGQKGANYHLGKLKSQHLADMDPSSRLWKALPVIATRSELLDQLEFLDQLKKRSIGVTKVKLDKVAHTLSLFATRDLGSP